MRSSRPFFDALSLPDGHLAIFRLHIAVARKAFALPVVLRRSARIRCTVFDHLFRIASRTYWRLGYHKPLKITAPSYSILTALGLPHIQVLKVPTAFLLESLDKKF